MLKKNINEGKKEIEKQVFLASFLLRIGLASVFLYAAVFAYLDSAAWIGFMPQLLKTVIPPLILLQIHSFFEIVLSLWLLSNKKTYYAGLVSAVIMLFILISNFGALDILFRDIAIFFSALALAVLTYEKRS